MGGISLHLKECVVVWGCDSSVLMTDIGKDSGDSKSHRRIKIIFSKWRIELWRSLKKEES